MKFTHLAAILALVAPAVMAMPADEGGDLVMRESPDLVMDLEARACGAAGSCKGINKNRLCKDRCKRCKGASGKYYKDGRCGGAFWQTCYCYYDA